ncbi:MAG: cob(I)yrinic acid a,c-diamide adenosyltransferase [Spirochaetaceae bacterium]|jgi:cob(I)alamin adenosyltransferase|nr:cob(I)yrinic acid a,c-diamide adenosyltransferase [Spirochaetaceae bacterium]
MIHIYSGDGKGKTTAAAGLAVRAIGRGFRVVFAQFLKSGESGELVPLEKLGIYVIRSSELFAFTFRMQEEEKERCRIEQARILKAIKDALRGELPTLVVADEMLDAVRTGMLESGALNELVDAAKNAELVFTGRLVPEWLAEKADYISDIKKIKHPYDNGVPARSGIEW